MKNVDLTPLFQAIITLLISVITYKVVPWLKEKTTQQQYENVSTMAKVAVYAAEQMYKNGTNKEKLAYAVKLLASYGYDLDEAALRSTIEKAVYEMKQEKENCLFLSDPLLEKNVPESKTESEVKTE